MLRNRLLASRRLVPKRQPKRQSSLGGLKRQRKGEPKPEFSVDNRGWCNEQVSSVNAVTNRLNTVMANCTREQHDKLRANTEPELLEEAGRNLHATCAKYAKWVGKPWEEAVAMLLKESRVRTTPRPARTPASAQPGA